MRLLDYLKTHDLDDAAFAEMLGYGATARAVRKWKYDETSPRIRALVRIQELTNGAVTPNDFLPPMSSPAPVQAMDAAE